MFWIKVTDARTNKEVYVNMELCYKMEATGTKSQWTRLYFCFSMGQGRVIENITVTATVEKIKKIMMEK